MSDQDNATPLPAGVPAAETPTSVADGRERKLDPAWIAASRLGRGIFATVLGLASLIGVSIFLLANAPPRPWPLVIAAGWLLFVAAVATLAWVWPGLSYRHTSYRIDDQGIRIRRGVVWRIEVSVPRSRIQHTDVSRGPVERSFDLATLIVHTAGTENASVSLAGLAERDAFRIRDFLIDAGDGDAV